MSQIQSVDNSVMFVPPPVLYRHKIDLIMILIVTVIYM